MIEKISLAAGNYIDNKYKKTNSNLTNPQISQQIQTTNIIPTSDNFKSYVVNFSGGKIKESKELKHRRDDIRNNMTPQAEIFLLEAQKVAQRYKNPEITQLHIHYVALKRLQEFINKLNSNEMSFFDLNDDYSKITNLYLSDIAYATFKKPELRRKILPVINEEILHLEKTFGDLPPENSSQKPVLSKNMINDAFNLFDNDNTGDTKEGDGKFDEGYLLDAAINTFDNKIRKQYIRPFLYNLKESIMLGVQSPHKEAHISLYDKNARNVLKNLDIGTNMFITYDEKIDPVFIVNSIAKMLRANEGYSHLNADTEIIFLNKYADYDYLNEKISRLSKSDSKSYIVIFDLDAIDSIDKTPIRSSVLNEKLSEYAPKNVKYIVLSTKDKYYRELNTDNSCFREYQSVTIPTLTSEQAKAAFREEHLLMAEIKKDFSPKAIDAVIDAVQSIDGEYPEKALKIMKKISAYYVDKKEISANDVKYYVQEAKEIFKSKDNNTSVIKKSDTGKRLKDMLGAKSTKTEIASIIHQIKNRSVGTKGYIIYPQDGQIGGGRRFCAEVIAGETKSPYFEINASDFGTKDVSILDMDSGQSVSPEIAMKNLFSVIKSQAEISPHKSAVLFIEDFIYFTFGEYVSEYHKKAMAQLIREMNNAQKEGLNIVVLGSVDSGDKISESTKKSFKFIDKIEVESINRNTEARKEIIENYINKNHIQLNADTQEQKDKLITNFAETTEYFTFIELMTLLGKTKNLMKEKHLNKLSKSDFIEAYLQITTGRPSSVNESEHRKKIVTSHECGHALNLAVMYQIAEKQNIPWHLPDKVNFITLDPRGDYGGAMYSKSSRNEEYSFEKIFADLVCSYGGHSSEKILYNQDGSWGITADLEHVTKYAYAASSVMAQGHYYGKKSINAVPFISENEQKKIEKDVEVFTKNAAYVSDLIVKNYKGFVEEFTQKYAHLVGTGDCLILSETFEDELQKWKDKQTPQKRHQLDLMERKILKIIKLSQQGKIINQNK